MEHMDRNLQLARAFNFVTAKHILQTDKSGVPYVFHPMGVARRVAIRGGSTEAIIAALCHDVVEDCGVSLDEIEAMFGTKVRYLVDAVSRREGETYRQFIRRVIASGKEAILIKLCDTEDNLDPDRMAKLTPQNRAFLHDRYGKSKVELEEAYAEAA